jgi:heptosyltransferase-2
LNLSKVKNLLIIRLSSLGDVLLSTPLIRTLKEKYPQLEIDYLIKDQYKDALIENPYLRQILIYPVQKDEIRKLSETLKSFNYDLIIDLQNNIRSRRLLSIFKTNKLKFEKKDFEKLLLVGFKINRLKKVPPIPVRYASVIDGFQLDSKGLDLFTDRLPSDLFLENQKYIGLCPGSKHFTKMWPKEYYIKLGNLLENDHYKIALFGGKDDKEICKEVSSQVSGSINLCNNDDLLQTAADMKKCSAIICNDSGLMHAACALKVPVLTFFGSTVKEFGFIPYKNKNIILENNGLSCRPCTHIGKSYCPKGHFKCMLEIHPEMAYNKLKFLLND